MVKMAKDFGLTPNLEIIKYNITRIWVSVSPGFQRDRPGRRSAWRRTAFSKALLRKGERFPTDHQRFWCSWSGRPQRCLYPLQIL